MRRNNFCSSFTLACSILLWGCEGRQQTIHETTIVPVTKDSTRVGNVSEPGPEKKAFRDTIKIKDQNISIKIFKNESPFSGFGYDILMNGKAYVHQPNIPAVAGNNGFTTEKAARRTAELVANKIRRNIMPPTVDVHELDSIGALK